MSLEIELPKHIEAKVVEQASAQGVDPQQFVQRAIQSILADGDPVSARVVHNEDGDILAPTEWLGEFRKWASSHKTRSTHVDDSRESIYEGRGE